MKARIRTIKPEIAKDEELWDLGQQTGLPVYQAFTVLWCYADREGRFGWRPRQLKSDVLPYWDGDFSRVLDALASRGFIKKYASNGRQFGVVCKFLKHQFINNREPASELPPPPEDDEKQELRRDDDATTTRESHAPHVTIPSLPLPDPIPDPKGGAGGAAKIGKPTNLTDALKVPIRERAKLIESDPFSATYLRPQEWPEILGPAKAFCAAAKRASPKLGAYSADSGVKALVALYSAGRTVEEVLGVANSFPHSDYFQENSNRMGLSNLTLGVVERELANDGKPKKRTGKGKPNQPNSPGANLLEPEYV